MYGIVEINGHQYKVQAGDIIDVEKCDANVDDTLNFDKVLFVSGKNTLVGNPTVNGAKIVAKVIRQARSRKITVLKRKPGKYVKKNGHRQHYTGLFITEVNNGAGESETATHTKKEKTVAAKKEAAPKKKAPAKKKATKKATKKTTKKKTTKK